MRIQFLRGSGDDGLKCPSGDGCPALYLSDRQTLIVQGYRTEPDEKEDRSEYTRVEVPLTMIPELATNQSQIDVRATERQTLIISGRRVSDEEALAALNLPDGEDAVEVELAEVSELKLGAP